MKKILTLVFVSVLGGALTLSAYKVFLEPEASITTTEPQQEQTTYLPTSFNNTNLLNSASVPNFVNAAEETVHAVVHVKNTAVVSAPTTMQDYFYGRRSQKAQVGTGSGVIINKNGYIITNNHVIAGAKELSITTNDNKIYQATLIGTDPKTDIALLKIDADEDLPYITFGDSDMAKIGEWVLAVGNPFNLTSTVTAGIISAKSRDLSGQNYQSFIQTDAAVNPGNSGGALVNSNGELIGINTAISSQTGSYIGYSFAVPSNIARKVVEDIMEFGIVQNGILGVSGISLNGKSSEELDVNLTEGFYVGAVEAQSGAEQAGIKKGDIITKIDNVRISKFADLTGYLSTKRPDDVVNVMVLRDNSEKAIPVTLSKFEILTTEFLDIQVKNISKDIKEQYQIDHGVLVTKSDNYWLYQKIGLNKGYIITDINDIQINSIDDISILKKKYGNALDKNIEKISIINTRGQKQSFIFR
ncbi:trypsin-like peptidase domain-containing protein [Bizionia sp. M204]|uniref:trypsin-like peptidase domain-containing protein n=1 Tax=Bizionia sp. M204 TaxID=2675331 RepID=UPI00204853CF|nr:trypsin-like peptidase domain-containing protein [Bizionia sp. M204]UPS90617.1 PDZ domain-containing protein [Bizionia sp. M204]